MLYSKNKKIFFLGFLFTFTTIIQSSYYDYFCKTASKVKNIFFWTSPLLPVYSYLTAAKDIDLCDKIDDKVEEWCNKVIIENNFSDIAKVSFKLVDDDFDSDLKWQALPNNIICIKKLYHDVLKKFLSIREESLTEQNKLFISYNKDLLLKELNNLAQKNIGKKVITDFLASYSSLIVSELLINKDDSFKCSLCKSIAITTIIYLIKKKYEKVKDASDEQLLNSRITSQKLQVL